MEEDGTVLGEYVYNGLGQRMKKTVDEVDTVFHWDLDDNIIAESDAAGTFAKEYLYRHSGRLAMVDVSSGEFYFYLNDNLGTPQMLTDAAGMVVWEGIYRPFGETDVNANSTVENNFRFAGQYFDAETGYHYNYRRYYDPNTGRYLSIDPIGLDGGISLFAYVDNNPANFIDPLGLAKLLGIHSNASLNDNFTEGHVWISFKDTDTGEYHTFGLYPDSHALAKLSNQNGPESDVRMDWELNYQSKYQKTYTLKEDQYFLLVTFIDAYASWSHL